MTTFGWDLCYTCNYRCPYCGIWERCSETDIIIPVSQWEVIWEHIFQLYGKCHIFVSGGEPATYPGFFDLVRMLSYRHLPELCTNLSWDIKKLIPEISPEMLRVAPTFHPTFANFEIFFDKVKEIKDYLPDEQIYYVAYPGQIAEMPQRSEQLKKVGIKLIPLPLRGSGYMINSEEEKDIIKQVSPYEGSEKIDYQLQNISPKGKRCRAGKDYAVIRVNGNVDRCSQYETGEVGKITEKGFSLFSDSLPCEKDYCPIESQWIE